MNELNIEEYHCLIQTKIFKILYDLYAFKMISVLYYNIIHSAPAHH